MTKPYRPHFNILMSVDTLGGVWTYALELINGLKSFEVQVVLATMGRRLNNHQKEQVGRLENVVVEESDFKLEWMDDPWEDTEKAGHWLLELEEKYAPDLIHLNSFVHACLPFQAPVVVVAHSDVCSWWQSVKKRHVPEKYLSYIHQVKDGLKKADCVVAPSFAMLKCINQHYGYMSHEQVIPKARDPQKFTPAKKKPFILSIGRLWDEAKNIQLLEKVADSLIWPIFIAGDNKHPGEDSPRNFKNVHFLGRLPEEGTVRWFSKASVYVMPARYEPFGLSVLEAALSGCALVLGDIESLRENWDKAALFVDPDQPRELIKKITMLQEDASFRNALASAAHERAQHFTPGKMVSKYMDLYHELLEKHIKKHQLA